MKNFNKKINSIFNIYIRDFDEKDLSFTDENNDIFFDYHSDGEISKEDKIDTIKNFQNVKTIEDLANAIGSSMEEINKEEYDKIPLDEMEPRDVFVFGGKYYRINY